MAIGCMDKRHTRLGYRGGMAEATKEKNHEEEHDQSSKSHETSHEVEDWVCDQAGMWRIGEGKPPK